MAEGLSEEELHELLHAQKPGSGSDSSSSAPLPLTYDFKRQQRVSSEQTRFLEGIHEQFARLTAASLSGSTRLVVDVELGVCDEIPYSEFILGLANPCAGYSYVLEPPGGTALLTISPELLMMVIDRSFGGHGNSVEFEPRTLTQIERKVVNRLATSVLNNLEAAWETAAAVEVRDVSFESNPEFIRIAAPSDPAVVLAFEVNSKGVTGQIHLCYPMTTLDRVLSRLAPRRPVPNASPKRKPPPASKAALAKIQVPIVVELANGHISLQELSSLQEGDVVKLDTVKSDPAVVIVGERPKFLGRPGLNGKKRVVRITTTISSAEEEKYQ